MPAFRQELHKGRFPFVVTLLEKGDLRIEELAFAVESDGIEMDVVRIRFDNRAAREAAVEIRLSRKRINLPGHRQGSKLNFVGLQECDE